MVRAIVGANWGDEGKGKITDVLAAESDVVIRFQGGSNAGHTIINQYGKFALHQLPSGVFYDHITNIIGNGVALDIGKFLREAAALKEKGVKPRLMVSDRTQVVMPYHVLFDQYEEERLGGKSFGSTKSGIAPFYSDKYAKIGFEINELFDEDYAYDKLRGVLAVKNVLLEELYHKPALNVDQVFAQLMEQRDAIAPYVADTFHFLRDALKEGKTILLEGQLGKQGGRRPQPRDRPGLPSGDHRRGARSQGQGLEQGRQVRLRLGKGRIRHVFITQKENPRRKGSIKAAKSNIDV